MAFGWINVPQPGKVDAAGRPAPSAADLEPGIVALVSALWTAGAAALPYVAAGAALLGAGMVMRKAVGEENVGQTSG